MKKPHIEREPIDASSYAKAPVLDVAGAVALAIQLLGLLPKHANDAVKAAARTLRDAVVALQADWAKRDAAGGPPLKPLDIALDAAWSALLGRLEPYASLAKGAHAKDAARAAELVAALFATRLDFTQLELASEWAESEKRVRRFAELGADLERLAGAPFVAAVRDAHAALGRALGTDGKPAPTGADGVDLGADLRTTLRAVSKYAIQLVAADDLADDATSKEIRRALSAIDAARPHGAAAATSAGTSASATAQPPTAPPAATPTTPVPQVPSE